LEHDAHSAQGLGCSFIAGGYSQDCYFNSTAAQTMSSLMVVASVSLVIPAALNMAFDKKGAADPLNDILILSRGTSIILLILYMLYLYFQLETHSRFFEQTNANDEPKDTDVRKEEKEYVLSPKAAVVALFVITLAIAVCADYLVSTVDDLVQTLHINRNFIGLIILPIVGNAAEQASAITAAAKGKADLALGVALGSSMQIALFVTPSLVILGWIINQPMNLCFESFDAVVFFLSVLVVCGLVPDGESNYLEGSMMVGTYVSLS
jgi:Ca2+:H+ antiporter